MTALGSSRSVSDHMGLSSFSADDLDAVLAMGGTCRWEDDVRWSWAARVRLIRERREDSMAPVR